MAMAADTTTRLLDAAEARFAADGFHAPSLRTITRDAGVNLAAVSYHFGSKDGLIEAVLLRRMVPMNAARMTALEAAEAAADGTPPALDAVLRALLQPCIDACRQPDSERLMDLMTRLHTEPDYAIRVIRSHFPDMVARFLQALTAAVPGLDPKTAFWRLHFVIGGLLHALGASRGVGREFREQLGVEHDYDELERQLLAFAQAGFAANLPEVAS